MLAQSGLSESELDDHLFQVSREMSDHFIHTADHLDSIKAIMSEDELETFKFQYEYIKAYTAFMKGRNSDAMRYVETALVHFLYSEQDEWAAKCMKLIANVSSSMLLFPESVKAYERVLKFTEDPYILGATYLNMARNRKTLHLSWQDALSKGIDYAEQSNDEGLILYGQMVAYWLHPDSADITTRMLEIAAGLNNLEMYASEADAYKCLVFHYLNKGDFQTSLYYVDKSITTYNKEERPLRALVASVHYLKGQLLLKQGDHDLAFNEFHQAVVLNKEGGYKANNYNFYRSMYQLEYKAGNYKEACQFSDDALTAFKYVSERRINHFEKMTLLFKKIDVIEGELLEIKRKATVRFVLMSVLLVLFFMAIILWFSSRKRHYEKMSIDMEGKNTKLKAEAGELLARANQNKVTSNIIKNQSDVERKMEKLFSQHGVLPDVVKEKYAETILYFNVKLPILSDTEKRYAVMIALDVPYKTIAELLNVKPETVAQYRNRLRKKLGIVNTDIELNAYLKTFIEE